MNMPTHPTQEMFINVYGRREHALWHPIMRLVHKDIRDTG